MEEVSRTENLLVEKKSKVPFYFLFYYYFFREILLIAAIMYIIPTNPLKQLLTLSSQHFTQNVKNAEHDEFCSKNDHMVFLSFLTSLSVVPIAVPVVPLPREKDSGVPPAD